MASEGMLNIQIEVCVWGGAASSLSRWERRWGGLEAAPRVNLPAAGSDTTLHPHPHPAVDPQNLRWGPDSRPGSAEPAAKDCFRGSHGRNVCLCEPGNGPRGPRERGWGARLAG